MYIKDYTIPTILRVARKSDSDRLSRRTEYSKFRLREVDPKGELLETNDLILVFSLPKEYIVTLKIYGYMMYFDIYMNKYNNIYQAINKALDWSLKNADVEVDCTCLDFKYRYAYIATQHDYKYGEKEVRPAKKTNPKNKGRVCKHILAVLMRPSNYSRKLESRLAKILSK